MANKVSFDMSDEYQASDSENEYTDREKHMLKKSRLAKEQNDSEEEILGFEESEDDNYDKFEADSDFDEPQGDDYIPDERAWGKTKQTFYNTDFNDQDYENYTEREEQQANQEQTEAREIQKRLANEFSEMDFNIDMFSIKIPKVTEEIVSKLKVAKSDLSDWSNKKKIATFSSEAPEFESLVNDFQNHLQESKQFLTPAVDLLNSFDIHSHPIMQFIDLKNKLSLGYCTNISYYLLMKSRRITVQRHPVVRRLVQIRELIAQLDDIYEHVIKPKLVILLANNDTAEDQKLKVLKYLKDTNINKNIEEFSVSDDLPKQLQFFDKLENEDDTVHLYDESDNEGVSKRKITRQIEKNKGLTAQKRKELRNPRVKNKIKFKKAVIRRKGAVQEVRSKTDLYGGEVSGVKTHLKRSVKIK
ncbi:unnamed protein product [Diamesa tonsa]